MNEVAIQTALNAAAIFMQNKKERLDYLNREMAILDYESDKDAWFNEGHAEGLAEGEKAADRRTAMRMLRKNKPISEIIELVDLSEDEVKALAKSL